MGRALKGAGGFLGPTLGPKSSEEGVGDWQGGRMDPGGVSSPWCDENQCLRQVFRKGEPVSGLREKTARPRGRASVTLRDTPQRWLLGGAHLCRRTQPTVLGSRVRKERLCGPHQDLYLPEGRAVPSPKGSSKGPPGAATSPNPREASHWISALDRPQGPRLWVLAGLGSSPSSSGTSVLPARPTILRARRGPGAPRHMLPAGRRPDVVLIAEAVLSPSKARAFFSLMGHEVNNNARAPSLQKQRSGERLPQRIFFLLLLSLSFLVFF